MADEVEVKNIVFKIGSNEIKLSLNEAKKLKELLNANFGGSPELPYMPPTIIDRQVPIYPQPYRWREWEITWQGDSYNYQVADRTGGTLYCSC